MYKEEKVKKNGIGHVFRAFIAMLLLALCFCAPTGSGGGFGSAGTITAQAASSSVKQLTVGKSYTVSGYAKVKSSKTSIATAKKKSSKKYTVKAKKKGTTILKCYNSSGKLVKKIYLIATNSSTLKYDTTAVTLTKGKAKTVKATVQSGCTVKYSSSNKSVATVSSAGKITAKAAGTATISAKAYYKGKCIKTLKKTVTVKTASSSASSSGSSNGSSSGSSSGSTSGSSSSGGSTSSGSSSSGSSGTTTSIPTLSVTFDASAVTISPGKTLNAKATVTSGYTVAYSSSDTTVATVSSSGVITGVSGGSATITVTISYNGTVAKTLTKSVTVRTYQLSGSTLSVDKGSSATLYCATSAKEYSSADSFVWSSSDTSVATVSGSGYSATVTGVAAGTATISCSVNGVVTLSCAVTVNKVYTYIASITPTNAYGECSLSGGNSALVAVWCEKASDTVMFTLSNDNAQLAELDATSYQSAKYDYYNETNAFYTSVEVIGRKQGTCELYVYINGSLFKTITITVTSTDTYYYDYITWKAELKAKLWTDDMSDVRKIIEFGDYVFGSQPYSSNSSPYGYAQNYGGNCWAAAYLIVDLAHDLGYEAEVFSPYYEWLEKGYVTAYSPYHYTARFWIDGVKYEAEATNNATNLYGYCCTWKEGTLIYDPSAGTAYATKPD